MDFYSDKGFILGKIAARRPLPGYVKTASAEPEDLPASAYADSQNKLFPLNNKANVYVSAIYAYAQPEKVASEIISKIEKAANIFCISDDVQKVKEFLTPLTRKEATAAPEIEFCDLGDRDMYGIAGLEAAQKAASHFLENWRLFRFEERTKVASHISTQLKKHGGATNSEIEIFAGNAFPIFSFLKNAILARKAGLDEQRAAELDVLASEICEAENPTIESLMKVAKAINDIDMATGMDRHYLTRIPSPHHSVFHVARKEASEIMAKVAIAGKTIFVRDLPDPSTGVYEAALGEKAKDLESEKIAEFISGLDDKEQRILLKFVC